MGVQIRKSFWLRDPASFLQPKLSHHKGYIWFSSASSFLSHLVESLGGSHAVLEAQAGDKGTSMVEFGEHLSLKLQIADFSSPPPSHVERELATALPSYKA